MHRQACTRHSQPTVERGGAGAGAAQHRGVAGQGKEQSDPSQRVGGRSLLPFRSDSKSGDKSRTISHLLWPRSDPSASVKGWIDMAAVPIAYEKLDGVFGQATRPL